MVHLLHRLYGVDPPVASALPENTRLHGNVELASFHSNAVITALLRCQSSTSHRLIFFDVADFGLILTLLCDSLNPYGFQLWAVGKTVGYLSNTAHLISLQARRRKLQFLTQRLTP